MRRTDLEINFSSKTNWSKLLLNLFKKNENNMRDSEKLVGSNVYFKSSTLIDGLAI